MSRIATPLLLAAAVLSACGGSRQYINANADLGAIRTVAVMPFENVTPDRLSSERIQRLFLTELLTIDVFDVVDPGLVVRTLKAERLDPAALTPEEIAKIGKALKVDALFFGSVLEADESRSGSISGPRVTLQFRLVDVASAKTIWAVTRTRGGATVASRLLGVGGKTATVVAEEIMRDELANLGR